MKLYPLFFIAGNNLKKRKGNTAVVFFLIALAAFLLQVSLTMLTQLGRALDEAHKETNSADYMFLCMYQEEEKITELFLKQEEVVELEIGKCAYTVTDYRKGDEKQTKSMSFLLETIESERNIDRLPAQYQSLEMNEILLPYYMKADGSFRPDDEITLKLGTHEYTFLVKGFAEEVAFGSPMNVGLYKCYISESLLEKAFAENEGLEERIFCRYYKVRLQENVSSQEFREKFTKCLIKEIPEASSIANINVSWESMKQGAGILVNIAMSIVLIFSILLISVALIIIAFNIDSFIEENMKNIGMLKASGYTTAQLRLATLMEMLFLSGLGIAVGIGLSQFFGKAIAGVLEALLGLPWKARFSGKAARITCLLVLLCVWIVTWTASRRYQKISVLDALRGGIRTHNFRKNPLALEKSRLPLPISLGMKSILLEKGKSAAFALIVSLVSFAACMGFCLYQNFAVNNTKLLRLIGMEFGTANITGEDCEKAGEVLKKLPEITKVIYYTNDNITLKYGDKEITVTCDAWDKPEEVENEMIIEGRLPKYENEMVLSVIISESLGVKTGDVISVEGTGTAKDFMVCGIDQKMNNMGLKVLVNFKGYQFLTGEKVQAAQSFIYGKTGSKEEFNKMENVLEAFTNIELNDSKMQLDSMIASVIFAMKLVCIVFVLITVFVVSMVVILFIKKRIVRERKNYGIMKGIGFTAKQLMLQTLMSNMPIMVTGSVLGVILANLLANQMVILCLRTFGIRKFDSMTISWFWNLITVIGISMLSMFVAYVCSLKIRKIEPVKMLMEVE